MSTTDLHRSTMTTLQRSLTALMGAVFLTGPIVGIATGGFPFTGSNSSCSQACCLSPSSAPCS